MDARWLQMGDTLRYSREADPVAVEVEGFFNFHHLTAAPGRNEARVQLEAGINPVAHVDAADGRRRPVVAIRSSPWKAGGSVAPWHDEFDLDHGHLRYFGDHKPDSLGMPGVTRGNKVLLETWRSHQGATRDERLQACPLVIFRGRTVTDALGRTRVKGHVEFCGVGLIERLEYIAQRDAASQRTFPNLALDICVIRLTDSGDHLDWRWIDDRRNPRRTHEETLEHAPRAWREWIDSGRLVLPKIRRRVLASRVLSAHDQKPGANTEEDQALRLVYDHFTGQKHRFELLAAKIAAQVLGRDGLAYTEGWLTRPGGDGGLDFVGRLTVGTAEASTPIVVLGQAKCVLPGSSTSPDQVARLVARLQRGWIGVFVTTGTFSRQAQVEVIDDRYPVVLVHGLRLAQEVRLLAYSQFGGDVAALLNDISAEYNTVVTHRRPEEVLSL